MITAQELARAFRVNSDLANTQCQGLAHADALVQPPVPGNCMNWVLGHVANSRNTVLAQLGAPTFMSEAHCKRYGYGSEPICADGDAILTLEQIMAMLEQSQAAIEKALTNVTEERLQKPVQSFLGSTSLAYLVFFLYRHESYHLGQTEVLRELALARATRG